MSAEADLRLAVRSCEVANLFLLPMASKLKTAAQALSHVREMVIEGMISIAQGENPRSIDYRLQSYLH